jgi:hypothetical protein
VVRMRCGEWGAVILMGLPDWSATGRDNEKQA